MTAPVLNVCVMLTAAEPSGDALGADLIVALRRRLGPDTRFVGLGGSRMAAEGVASPFDIAELSVVGLLEGLLAYRRVARRADQIAALAARERPDVAVLIDSWGFSYLLARRLRRRLPDLKLVKYVAPQVWASRPRRAKALARLFDHVLSIVGFEPPVLEAAGARVTFVGNPAAERDISYADPARLRARIGAEPDDPVLIVLPGSRRSEIERLLPPFEAALKLLKAERPALQVVVVAASSVADVVKSRVAGWPFRAHVIEDGPIKDDAMLAATVALACSGTATTELAAAGCPMVVAYRLGPLAWRIAKSIVLTDHITLFNIAAGQAIAPEMLQDDCNGPDLARELSLRLDDPALSARQVAAQRQALVLLAGPGGQRAGRAADRAADVIVRLLEPGN